MNRDRLRVEIGHAWTTDPAYTYSEVTPGEFREFLREISCFNHAINPAGELALRLHPTHISFRYNELTRTLFFWGHFHTPPGPYVNYFLSTLNRILRREYFFN